MENTHLDVWILAGQSNMEGCGLLAEAVGPDERVSSFTSAGNWETACEPLHWFWESYTPVHIAMNRRNWPEHDTRTDAEMAADDRARRVIGAGLGLPFARAIADATGQPVALLPCAHGGTSITEWSQDLAHQGGASLYGAMIDRARRAGDRQRGILWYQGESDCSPQDAPLYAGRLDAWIAAARRDLDAPDLPFLAVQLGRWIGPADDATDRAWDAVRDALAALPDRVANTAVTGAADLPLVDGIHISANGLKRLGRRLSRLALAMGSGADARGPLVEAVEAGTAPNGLGTVLLRCANVCGGWRDGQPLLGFETGLPDGGAGAPRIVGAEVVGEDRSDIRLTLEGPISAPLTLAYATGINPAATVVDEADMPLLAFLPRTVAGAG